LSTYNFIGLFVNGIALDEDSIFGFCDMFFTTTIFYTKTHL